MKIEMRDSWNVISGGPDRSGRGSPFSLFCLVLGKATGTSKSVPAGFCYDGLSHSLRLSSLTAEGSVLSGFFLHWLIVE